MRKFNKFMGPMALMTLIAVALALGSCGGGGGGGSDDLGTSSAGESGNVALFVADGPADDYDEITICVTKVSLIPADRNPNQSPVEIYESDNCLEINLLDLRDEDFLLTVKKRVPAGWYSKIRLEVEDIWAESGPCDTFKLPAAESILTPARISCYGPEKRSPYAWISMPTSPSTFTRPAIRANAYSGRWYLSISTPSFPRGAVPAS